MGKFGDIASAADNALVSARPFKPLRFVKVGKDHRVPQRRTQLQPLPLGLLGELVA